MKYIVFFVFLIPMLSSCSRTPIYWKIENQIVSKYVREVTKKDDLLLEARGGAGLTDIKGINLGFLKIDPFMNVDQVRVLYVNNAENLLERINSSEKIRPYLRDFPFTIKNLDFSIAFLNNKLDYPASNFVSYVVNKEDRISYAYYDVEKDSLETLYSESYQEALEIVQSQQCLK